MCLWIIYKKNLSTNEKAPPRDEPREVLNLMYTLILADYTPLSIPFVFIFIARHSALGEKI